MQKHRTGLQKEVSSIFDGVPIPKSNGGQQPPHTPAPVGNKQEPAQQYPNYQGRPQPNKGHLGTPAFAKPPAQGPQTSATPQPQQPAQSPPKAASPKQSKAGSIAKTAKQVPWQQTLERIKNKLFAPKQGVSTTRQKAMTILVPGLFIGLIFVLTRAFSTPLGKKTEPARPGPANVVATSVRKIDWQVPALYPTTLRDPMQIGSAATTQAGTGRLIVRGIVYSKDRPSAIIGSQIVYEGDEVLNATILRINEDSVEFEMNDKTWTQKVQQ